MCQQFYELKVKQILGAFANTYWLNRGLILGYLNGNRLPKKLIAAVEYSWQRQ